MVPVKIHKRMLEADVIASVTSFYILYLLIMAVGTMLMTLEGLDIVSAISAVAATWEHRTRLWICRSHPELCRIQCAGQRIVITADANGTAGTVYCLYPDDTGFLERKELMKEAGMNKPNLTG
jgi:positive regulator of sigma E activity